MNNSIRINNSFIFQDPLYLYYFFNLPDEIININKFTKILP